MNIDMVLNELSFRTPASDVETARKRMLDLMQVARAAIDNRVKKNLRLNDDEFYGTLLANGYTVSDWLFNDPRVKNEAKEEWQLFLGLLDKGSCEKPMSDFFYNGERAEGLGIAYLSESLALSMRTDPPDPLWEPSIIELQHEWIEEDGEDEEDKITINYETVEVRHASKVEHIQEHRSWIEERIKNSVRDGLELWERRNTLFPNLEFCEDARQQIEKLKRGDKMLRPVKTRLLQLEKYCKNWKTGAFETDKIVSKVTLESQATLQQYGEKRKIRCPDGEIELFSWHVRLTPGDWRIYFLPDEKRYKIIIGYIGRHLRTRTDKGN
ncbi:MAG: hypothetical protein F6J93_05635 [Oscillatoria sp. SIO1A7]|nr:hypothetical protein [Oscillatoria sp. SIO1A7]